MTAGLSHHTPNSHSGTSRKHAQHETSKVPSNGSYKRASKTKLKENSLPTNYPRLKLKY